MKKIYLTALVLSACTLAGAQTMYDAITFSETSYYGTARSMALSNALTAVGGDLGSVEINPAGSAVSPYSQISFTPGFSIASTGASYSQDGGAVYGATNRDSKSRFTFPNTGFVLNYDTGNRRGVQRYTLGFLVSTTANHLGRSTAFCSGNDATSMLGSFAAGASGIQSSEFNVADPYNSTMYSWNTIMAAESGMISNYESYTDQYVGATEQIGSDGLISVGGPLYQRSAIQTLGSNSDMVMNFGLDISDRLFLGFNLGIPVMRYRYSECFDEMAVNTGDFAIEYEDGTADSFKSARYQYGYEANVDGIYAKLGFIAIPVDNLRVGAAIKTPTALTIRESWIVDGSIRYTSGYSGSSTSPQGDWTYCLRSPWEANFGAAYTFGKYGFISADYELTDYSVMKFSDLHEDDFYVADPFYEVNRLNKLFCGVQHSVRVGVEFKPLPSVAVRAGWSVTTSPERTYTDELGMLVDAAEYEAYFDDFENGLYHLKDMQYVKESVKSVSLGIGYSSPGSFFADFGMRLNKYPASYFRPYADYIFDEDGKLEAASPLVMSKKTLIDAAFTIGWRF